MHKQPVSNPPTTSQWDQDLDLDFVVLSSPFLSFQQILGAFGGMLWVTVMLQDPSSTSVFISLEMVSHVLQAPSDTRLNSWWIL